MAVCEYLKLDETLLFICESGEYELVFTIPPETEQAFLSDAWRKGLSFNRVGTISKEEEYILITKVGNINFRGFDLHARNFPGIREYLAAAIEFLASRGYQK
jgi:thiamine monophosphate kinase